MAARYLLFLLLCSLKISEEMSVLEPFSKVLAYASTSLSVYAGSSDMAAFAKLEKAQLQEAKEVYWNTLLTLANDINNGIVLPGVEKMVEFVKKNEAFQLFRKQVVTYSAILADKVQSKTLDQSWLAGEKKKLELQLKRGIHSVESSGDLSAKKLLKRATRWFRNSAMAAGKAAGKVLAKALGPLGDMISTALSAHSLKIAVENGDTKKIISSSLALASGIVGIATFAAVTITGLSILGPIGLIVGALLSIAATLVELFGGSSINEFREQVAQLNEIKNASIHQLYSAIEFLNETGRPFNDVYVVNEGNLLKVEAYSGHKVELREGSGFNRYSLIHRKPLRVTLVWKDQPEVNNGTFLLQGNLRRLPTPIYYDYDRSQYVKTMVDSGFDFYGKNANGNEYIGVTVLVKTNLISKSDVPKNAILINTTVPISYKQDDVVRLGDYENIIGSKKVTIDTGPGNDAVNIDGLVGSLKAEQENRLEVTLGAGINTLNFGGMSREETRFNGVLFELKTGNLSYIVDIAGQLKRHFIGFVHNVSYFSGSPLNDTIILQLLNADNKQDLIPPNLSDLFRVHFVVSESQGTNVYIVDLSDISSAVFTNMSIIDHSHNQSYIIIYDPTKSLSWKNLVYQNNTICIYKSLRGKLPRALATIKLRFPNKSPKIQLAQEHQSDWLELTHDQSRKYAMSISEMNPVLYKGKKRLINFNIKVDKISAAERNSLVVLECPPNQDHTFTQTVQLGSGIDYFLVSMEFIEQCVETSTGQWRFTLERYPQSYWYISILDSNSNLGLPNVNLHGVEKIINEYGHVIVDLESTSETYVDLYERYFHETKRQLGYTDTIEEEKIVNEEEITSD